MHIVKPSTLRCSELFVLPCSEPEPPVETDDVPGSAQGAKVCLTALQRVLYHGQNVQSESNRFSITADPNDAWSTVSRNTGS